MPRPYGKIHESHRQNWYNSQQRCRFLLNRKDAKKDSKKELNGFSG
jgi:hypothetical protein